MTGYLYSNQKLIMYINRLVQITQLHFMFVIVKYWAATNKHVHYQLM